MTPGEVPGPEQGCGEEGQGEEGPGRAPQASSSRRVCALHGWNRAPGVKLKEQGVSLAGDQPPLSANVLPLLQGVCPAWGVCHRRGPRQGC